METVTVNLLLVIAVISALTEAIKRLTMKKFPYFASFTSLLLGLSYVSLGKYFFEMYNNMNWLNAVVLGLAIGLAATGGYENIKNIITMGSGGAIKKPQSQDVKEERMG